MEGGAIKASKREPAGRRAAYRLRKSGMVPAIIYGHGEPPLPVSLQVEQLSAYLSRGAHLVDLDLDGEPAKLLVKDVQYDHMQSNVTHVDLARVSMDERVTVSVPLRFRGTPVGVKIDGGQLLTPLTQIELECLVVAIPDEIRVNVAELKVGDHLTVAELELPADVKALDNPEQVVALVAEPQAEEAVAAAAEAGPTEPEVIGRKAEEPEAEPPAAGKKAEKKE